jgi:serine/threonine-protein kinase
MASQTAKDVLPPRYTAAEAVAQGGMGVIYKARDEALGRIVAVKLLAEHHARDESLRERFTREALAAARLSSDAHTVTIYDVGEWNGRPYIVMEFAAGGTVADRLGERGHEPGEALRWLEQAAVALDAAHSRGVVHRDVKPANLLLTQSGEVRVADFGIASAVGLTSLTETGSVLGTLGYLAPEQALGKRVGPEADRYALAVVAYELLAGRRPFEHATGAAEAVAAGREPVPPISALGPGLPAGLDAVFDRALAKEPADRYPSCAEFVGDVRRAFGDAAGTTRVWPAQPSAASVRRARSARRAPRLLLPLAALALLAGAGAGAAALLTRDSDEPRQARQPAPVTVTAQGRTVTVTAAAPTTAPAQDEDDDDGAGAAPPPSSSATGSSLNDSGYRAMRAGDYRTALPLLEQAVARLANSRSLTEAYALYNLAYTRFALGRCDGVLDMLDRSEQIQGHRSEIDSLRRRARGCD